MARARATRACGRLRRELLVLVSLVAVACGTNGSAPGPTSDASAEAALSDDADAGVDAGGDALSGDAAGDDAGSLCPSGSALLADRRACPGTPLVAPAPLKSAVVAATRGDVVTLGGLNEGTAPCLPAVLCTPSDAPAMLFSDSPESPTSDGVLYADTVPAGRARIYVYHTNGGNGARKFSIVALNQGASPVTVTTLRRGVAAPSKNYVLLGKTVLSAWFASAGVPPVTVPPATRVVLDTQLDALSATKDDLVHAIEDISLSGPLKISVVTVAPNADTAAVTAGLSLLPKDANHDRGTFPKADVLVVATAPADSTGVRHLRFGGNVTEPSLAGTDATTGAPATLLGNYGLRYVVSLLAGPRLGIGISPRGAAWGGVARVAVGEDGPASVLPLPAAAATLGTTTEGILVGRFAAGATPATELVTAGGSNLPIDLFFVPL